jgi:ubiquinone/menaquinone biosynthesis C-methylase UbiE
VGTEVDAAAHRAAKTQGREFVSRAVYDGVHSSEHPDSEITRPPQVVPASEGYELWARSYDDAPNPLLAREERYLTPVLNRLRFKSVLDFACGTGRWLEKLFQLRAGSGVGIDLSAAMLRVAARKSTIRGRLAQAAGAELPLAAAVFDLAICSFALGHMDDLASAACELRRVTKVGADVFVTDLHPGAYRRGWRVGFRDRETSVQIEVHARSTDEVVAAFSSNGFKCVSELPLWLGEPEQPLFARAGKSELFEDACQLPAIFVCHFRRVASHTSGGTG